MPGFVLGPDKGLMMRQKMGRLYDEKPSIGVGPRLPKQSDVTTHVAEV